MHRKENLYNKAILLRRKGLSYNEILKWVPVAQGTISRWCHGIPLTKKQKEHLAEKIGNNPHIRALRKQAVQSRKEAKVWAREQVIKLSNKEQLLLVSGILLYWAEGARYGVRNSIEFTNTDPRMIKIMMEFFRKILDIPDEKFRIIVRIDNKGDLKRAKKYWSRVTKVSQKNFRKPEILHLTKNSKSINKYPYGMCRIMVHDISVRRKVFALIEQFSKKFEKL